MQGISAENEPPTEKRGSPRSLARRSYPTRRPSPGRFASRGSLNRDSAPKHETAYAQASGCAETGAIESSSSTGLMHRTPRVPSCTHDQGLFNGYREVKMDGVACQQSEKKQLRRLKRVTPAGRAELPCFGACDVWGTVAVPMRVDVHTQPARRDGATHAPQQALQTSLRWS